MSKKNKGGRPPVIDEVTLQKLELAFKVGCPDEEACFYADISMSTLYNYQAAHLEFLEKKTLWKKRPVLKARQVVVQALENNDLATAKWYLERKEPKDFEESVNLRHSGVVASMDIPESYKTADNARIRIKQELLTSIHESAIAKAKAEGKHIKI